MASSKKKKSLNLIKERQQTCKAVFHLNVSLINFISGRATFFKCWRCWTHPNRMKVHVAFTHTLRKPHPFTWKSSTWIQRRGSPAEVAPLWHRGGQQFCFGTVAVKVQNSFGYELTWILSRYVFQFLYCLCLLHNVCLHDCARELDTDL